jgi:hypothetical protein
MDGWIGFEWQAGGTEERKKERKLRMEERPGERINEINEAE